MDFNPSYCNYYHMAMRQNRVPVVPGVFVFDSRSEVLQGDGRPKILSRVFLNGDRCWGKVSKMADCRWENQCFGGTPIGPIL